MKYFTLLSHSLLLSSTLLFGCGGSSSSDETDSSETTTPASPDTSTTPVIIINEIVANAADGGNDWIELYAVSGTVNLSSYSLVDDNENHSAQALPDVTLVEGEFIVIQAIDETDTAPTDGYYVTFKLGSDDAVTLFNDGVQVDSLDWQDGDALQGTSYGVLNYEMGTESTNNAQTLSPTPGEANQEASTEETVVRDAIVNENASLRINEIMAKDGNNGYDWIEFYVSGNSSVYLGDYTVADENNELFTLPNVNLSAGEFYRVYATTDEVDNIDKVNLKLGSNDQLSLYLGDDLIDQLNLE
ncbi:lamin tail domain-containing protein [Colwellia sp. MSW7]|uniref:Lamin tail domain-containing protein n=1 Tax=Colwellia maritima TaxID=2912588 RepID=A0ABS9X6G5_9GAMM|nr:lamin tail domain-containing protein [Colwellia maritima]MCI2285817.1 lamin tail domain-containing protein [Colwellia maritima]